MYVPSHIFYLIFLILILFYLYLFFSLSSLYYYFFYNYFTNIAYADRVPHSIKGFWHPITGYQTTIFMLQSTKLPIITVFFLSVVVTYLVGIKLLIYKSNFNSYYNNYSVLNLCIECV
uniref:Uncharacterized protein n=1 Tax=Cacopsylla melanoneura TaxID=428564 RepID=A0A8D9F2X8_9HEMI